MLHKKETKPSATIISLLRLWLLISLSGSPVLWVYTKQRYLLPSARDELGSVEEWELWIHFVEY